MPSGFPSSLDSFAVTRQDSTANATTQAADHNNYADALNKIEAELGTLPRGSFADVKTRLNAVGQITVAQKVAPVSITNGAAYIATWDTELRDDGNWFTAGNSYIQVASAGVYLVTLQASWASNNVGVRSVHLRRNANTHPIEVLAASLYQTAQWESAVSISWCGPLIANDQLAVSAYQSSGGALNFGGNVRTAGTTSANSEFSVTRLA